MPPPTLSELLRAWRETQDVEIGARYLQERVRTGELETTDLQFAAQCGFMPARQALSLPRLPIDLTTWSGGLMVFGQGRVVDVGLAAVEPAVLHWEAARPDVVLPRRALSCASAWRRDPSPIALRRAREVSEDIRRALSDWQLPSGASIWTLQQERSEIRRGERIFEAAQRVAAAAAALPNARTPLDAVEKFVATKAAREVSRAVNLAVLVVGEQRVLDGISRLGEHVCFRGAG